jgi:hypothetical protein
MKMRTICKIAISWSAVLFMVFFLCRTGDAQSEAGYAGWKACMVCHQKITESWQRTPHAKAIESLRKTSQESLPGCVSCHVTGYEQPGGYVDLELTPELEGVQCEACHGPAKGHLVQVGRKAGMAAVPGKEVCRKCHTPGQDPKFDYDTKARMIHPR